MGWVLGMHSYGKRCWALHLHSLTKLGSSFSLPLKASEDPLKTFTGHSWSILIAPTGSVAWMRSPLMHMQIAYIQYTAGLISLCQDGFCTNLESKNINVIAYPNKKPVAYKIFILIGKLIAYLIMLKQVLWISEMRTASLRMTKMKRLLPLWGLLKFKGSLSE